MFLLSLKIKSLSIPSSSIKTWKAESMLEMRTNFLIQKKLRSCTTKPKWWSNCANSSFCPLTPTLKPSLIPYGLFKRWEIWENARTSEIALLALMLTKSHTRSTQSRRTLSKKITTLPMIWHRRRGHKKSCSTPTWTRSWWTLEVRTGSPCKFWIILLLITWIMYITPWKCTIKGRNARA